MLRTLYGRVAVRVHRLHEIRAPKVLAQMETHVQRHRVRNMQPTVPVRPSCHVGLPYVLFRNAVPQTTGCYVDDVSAFPVSLFRSRRVRRQLLVHMNQFNGHGTARVAAESNTNTHSMSSAYPGSHSTQLVPFADVHSSRGNPCGHTHPEHTKAVVTGVNCPFNDGTRPH